jgi:hypothetical protein
MERRFQPREMVLSVTIDTAADRAGKAKSALFIEIPDC